MPTGETPLGSGAITPVAPTDWNAGPVAVTRPQRAVTPAATDFGLPSSFAVSVPTSLKVWGSHRETAKATVAGSPSPFRGSVAEKLVMAAGPASSKTKTNGPVASFA